MIDEAEVAALRAAYGQPQRVQRQLEIGPELFQTRFNRLDNRRGEVVLALERPAGTLLLHSKAHYEAGVYRLLSGGVNLGETVLAALHREVAEETGLRVTVERFIAVLDMVFCFGPVAVPFPSYVFHVREASGTLRPDQREISGLLEVVPEALPQIAATLRDLQGSRADWGRWRAIAHELVAEALQEAG
jgi:ADP-ribose pyrophosphatase YjhB (NUDIX family)